MKIRKVKRPEWVFYFTVNSCAFAFTDGVYSAKIEFDRGQIYFARADVVESFHLFKFAKSVRISSFQYYAEMKYPTLTFRSRKVPTPSLLATAFSAERWITLNDEMSIQWV